MTRKQLPKAIKPASLQIARAGAIVDENSSRAAPAEEAKKPEWAQRLSLTLPANDPDLLVSLKLQKLATKRRAFAGRIVERHGLYATLSGLAPLPAINIAGVSTTILHMLRQLSELYQIRFERDRTRSLVLAILGGTVPTGIGGAVVSTAALVAPLPAFVGLAISALTADAVTRAIGEVFVESFEREAPLR
jgi:uncharacterized protein (DUF697 family)